MVSQFLPPDVQNGLCIAISTTGDPTGSYHTYEFDFSGIGFPDYPKFGFATGALSVMVNLFDPYQGSALGVIDKAEMLAGDPATLVLFTGGEAELELFTGWIPGDNDGPVFDNTLPTFFTTLGFFDDGDTILTHCNTSGELLLTARFCRTQTKGLTFFATETRPYFQGRLTAWELSTDGFDVTLIPDNRVASLLNDGRCNKVITGADRVALNGDIVNKTGTRQLAMLAHRFGIPFYAFVQEPGTTATGKDVPIEYRDRTEVVRFRGRDIYPAGTDAFYPAFDMTPHRYITALITFEKILKPADLPAGWGISD